MDAPPARLGYAAPPARSHRVRHRFSGRRGLRAARSLLLRDDPRGTRRGHYPRALPGQGLRREPRPCPQHRRDRRSVRAHWGAPLPRHRPLELLQRESPADIRVPLRRDRHLRRYSGCGACARRVRLVGQSPGARRARRSYPRPPVVRHRRPGLPAWPGRREGGNFFNKELFGPETTLPWGIPIYDAGANFPWDSTTAARHHPLFLYESLLSLLGVIVLLWVGRRFALRLRQGDVLFFYFIWYALERSALELLRSDNWRLGAVPVAHIASAVLIAVALAALVLWRGRRPYLDGTPSRDGAPSRDGNASRAIAPNAPGGADPRSRAAQRRASRRAASSDDDGSASPDGGDPAGG